MNRLVKQSVAAAATLMLASAAHASLVTYEFTGTLTIGPMGDLAVPQDFSGHVSFRDGLRDRDRSDSHGQYVDHRRVAMFETRIGDQDFIVHGGRHGEIDVDIYDNDPSVGGGADGLGIYAANRHFSMGFFQLYDADVFHDTRYRRSRLLCPAWAVSSLTKAAAEFSPAGSPTSRARRARRQRPFRSPTR
ncbi:MAG TPA: hypothetical protein VH814_17125 [Steroidobacteraceae bacterium]|jgi:hypothetical protein